MTIDLHHLRKVRIGRSGVEVIRNRNARYFEIVIVNKRHLIGIFGTIYI